jgi:hypothetical protein
MTETGLGVRAPEAQTLPWFLIMGCFTSLIFMVYRIVGVAVQDHQAALVRWLVSFNILAACLVAAAYGISWRCSWRVGWVLVLVGLSGVVFLGRPNPEYYQPINIVLCLTYRGRRRSADQRLQGVDPRIERRRQG